MRALKYSFIVLLSVVFALPAQAQYFGRNKVNYEDFDFEVHESDNFEIYHYFNNPQYLQQFADWSEQWYALHQNVLADTIQKRNPLILYANHGDFQQTNAIFGQVSVGTGGVTEAFKNRVIMPVAMSNQQTHHVLGHELVHAFQYNMIINSDSTSLQNLSNLPLWLVEGLAEYMSIGSTDAHTAMWMRDAVLNDDVPTIRDLSNPKYFPYRYGQTFWVFLTGMYGDEIIEPFYTSVAKFGFEAACNIVLGMSQENLSELWVSSFKQHFGQFIDGEEERFIGRELLSEENAGRMNISPVLSPNGRYVIFLSEKDLFGIDLYLADATNGEIIRKVASATQDGHIDAFNYIESAGTWSPDGEQFAFVAFSKGRNILVIKETTTGKTVDEIVIEGVPAFTNPSWSPDGDEIAMSGLVDGQIDIYSYNLELEEVEQLTNDPYSEMHVQWSQNGSLLLFSTDELSYERGRVDGKLYFNLAEMDIVSRNIEHIEVFPGADNLNPSYDRNGDIWFLSNRDGYRNIYKYEVPTGKVFQMTDMITGVSGITHYAPAMTLDTRRDRVAYMHFSENKYSIYRARMEDFLYEEVDPQAVDFTAAKLPRVNPRASTIVDQQLAQLDRLPIGASLRQTEYRPQFQLDYIGGGGGVGVGTSNTFGTTTGLVGAVEMLFSDILGNNQFFTSLSVNGEISDFGGAVSYINRSSRLTWGATLSHIPFRSAGFGGRGFEQVPIDDNNSFLALADTFFIQRIFEQKLGGFAAYPFSQTLRLEGSANATRYSSRLDRYVNLYQTDGTFIGNLIAQDREKVDSGDAFFLYNFGGALVGDNSYFGLTAPLRGHRFRFGAEQYYGEFKFTAATADFRIYKFFKPIGLAFRAMHYGRYGDDANALFPIYVGNPWYVRGYNNTNTERALLENGQSFDQLVGSKIGVANFEIRIPFTGPERLSLIKSGFLFSDLNFFIDGAIAWNDFDQFNPPEDSGILEAEPIFSMGASLRVNLFGAIIVEPFYAVPLLDNASGTFGLNFLPGW
jgi:hypothetical protein